MMMLSVAASLAFPSFPSPLSFLRRKKGPTPRCPPVVVFFRSPGGIRERAWNYSNRTRMISPNFGQSTSKMWGEERRGGVARRDDLFLVFLSWITKKKFWFFLRR